MAALESFKDIFTKTLWRTQQVQIITQLIFWLLLTSVVLLDYVSWRLTYIPITVQVPLIMLALATVIYAFGVVYDKYLRMWEYQSTVLMERNIFTIYKIQPLWDTIICSSLLPTAREVTDEETYARMVQWLDFNHSDPNVRATTENFIKEFMREERSHEIQFDWNRNPLVQFLEGIDDEFPEDTLNDMGDDNVDFRISKRTIERSGIRDCVPGVVNGNCADGSGKTITIDDPASTIDEVDPVPAKGPTSDGGEDE